MRVIETSKRPHSLSLATLVPALALSCATVPAQVGPERMAPHAGGEEASLLRQGIGGGARPAQELKISAKPGSGITFDLGDSFKLRLKNRIQAQWRYLDNDVAADVNSFRMRRIRTDFSGHAFDPSLTYKLQLDWTDSGGAGTVLKDAWVRYRFFESESGDDIALRFGQTKMLFGRQSTGSAELFAFVDRALASVVFANARSRGVILEGSHLAHDEVSWNFGVFNRDVANASTASSEEGNNVGNELTYVFNVRFDPMGSLGWESFDEVAFTRPEDPKLSFGAGAMFGNAQAGNMASGADVESVAANVNVGGYWDGWSALAEAFWRSDEGQAPAATPDADAMGFQAQLFYLLPPEQEGAGQWGFGGRWSRVNLSDAPVLLTGSPLGAMSGHVSEYSLGVSRFHYQHRVKTQLTYTFQRVAPHAGAGLDNHIVELQLQLVF